MTVPLGSFRIELVHFFSNSRTGPRSRLSFCRSESGEHSPNGRGGLPLKQKGGVVPSPLTLSVISIKRDLVTCVEAGATGLHEYLFVWGLTGGLSTVWVRGLGRSKQYEVEGGWESRETEEWEEEPGNSGLPPKANWAEEERLVDGATMMGLLVHSNKKELFGVVWVGGLEHSSFLENHSKRPPTRFGFS